MNFFGEIGNALSLFFKRIFDWFIVVDWVYPGNTLGYPPLEPRVNFFLSIFRVFTFIIIPITGFIVIIKISSRKQRKKAATDALMPTDNGTERNE